VEADTDAGAVKHTARSDNRGVSFKRYGSRKKQKASGGMLGRLKPTLRVLRAKTRKHSKQHAKHTKHHAVVEVKPTHHITLDDEVVKILAKSRISNMHNRINNQHQEKHNDPRLRSPSSTMPPPLHQPQRQPQPQQVEAKARKRSERAQQCGMGHMNLGLSVGGIVMSVSRKPKPTIKKTQVLPFKRQRHMQQSSAM
jgi:hypothetical protein